MFGDNELLPISALQHYTFCPRRAALVFLERQWADNRYTAEGRRLHTRVHDVTQAQSRPGVRITRGLEVCSYRLGLAGKCDVVEFHENPSGRLCRPVIVEYKRGRPREVLDLPFRVQTCAQAMCLEEMMNVKVEAGYLFFGKTRHRVAVLFDQQLRRCVETAAEALHHIMRSGETPTAKYQPRCRRCSLLELCMPKLARPRATAARYLARIVHENRC